MSVTEFDLIDRYFKDLTANQNEIICGIGDDAAVIELPAETELVVSVDTLVSDVHFFPSTDPFDIGFKSLSVNLSDIAAMAAEPRWATLSLTIPDVNTVWLEEFARGFSELANQYSIGLIGGDLSCGPLSITIQILGIAQRGSVVKRSGAKPGDLIYVSGDLGGAGYALKILKEEIPHIQEVPAHCQERLLRPIPRVEIGNRLAGFATSAIDISDGIAADLGHIIHASSVGAEVELDKIPICAGLEQIHDMDYLWQIVLCSGDDYELCFTLPESHKNELEKELVGIDCPITCIGKIVIGKECRWLLADGSEYEVPEKGYRHF